MCVYARVHSIKHSEDHCRWIDLRVPVCTQVCTVHTGMCMCTRLGHDTGCISLVHMYVVQVPGTRKIKIHCVFLFFCVHT